MSQTRRCYHCARRIEPDEWVVSIHVPTEQRRVLLHVEDCEPAVYRDLLDQDDEFYQEFRLLSERYFDMREE